MLFLKEKAEARQQERLSANGAVRVRRTPLADSPALFRASSSTTIRADVDAEENRSLVRPASAAARSVIKPAADSRVFGYQQRGDAYSLSAV